MKVPQFPSLTKDSVADIVFLTPLGTVIVPISFCSIMLVDVRSG